MKKFKLGELCEIVSSKRIFEEEYVNKGVPFIRGQEITNGTLEDDSFDNFDCYISRDRYEEINQQYGVPQKGDILITAVGTIGNVLQLSTNREFYFKDGNILWLRNFADEVDSSYLCFFLQTPYFKKILGYSLIGAVQKALTIIKLSQLEIFLPTLQEQKTIATFLNTLNKKIKTNNKINDNLSKLAKELYDYWFVQFDFPDEDGRPYKSSGGKMVWEETLKKNIPEGWMSGSLSKLISEMIPGDWGNEVSKNNYCCEVRCIRGTDFESLSQKKTLEAPTRFILKKNLEKKKLLNGDILIEVSGGSPTQSTGRVCYINKEVLERFSSDIIVSNFCRGLRPNKEIYTYWLYCTWNRLYDTGLFFRYEGKTTGIKNLLLEDFLSRFNLALPPDSVINSFHQKVEPLFRKIQKNNIEKDNLEKLKHFLLPLLMNGQVLIRGG